MKSTKDIYQYVKLNKKSNQTYIVGIDGPGGAGKTTLAKSLKNLDKYTQIIHMDDFDLPTNGQMIGDPNKKAIGVDVDWRRLQSEVIEKLINNLPAKYLPYDRESGSYGSLVVVNPGTIVIIEGVFALRKELYQDYDLTIWLECDRSERIERVIRRDGKDTIDRLVKDWMPMEDRYIKSHKPQNYVDFVIDSKGLV